MLPLWIVDLRKNSDRRRTFLDLLGQINNVYLPDSLKRISDPSPEPDTQKATDETPLQDEEFLPTPPGDIETAAPDADISQDAGAAAMVEITVEEQIENDEKIKARKESIVEGDWWRYTLMDARLYKVDITTEYARPESTTKQAEILYQFQTDLVNEGQRFIRGLRESNVNPDMKFNVVVLGDLDEDFTRVVFPSVAGLLQKEKGRFLPHHIHQGMEIIGMLFVPSDINSRQVKERESMQRTLNEVDVQHKVADMRGYDHVMIYQDVQNRTDCHYPALDDHKLAEYLFQCLINLYFATNITHPLLSGTASAEDFYFSMGATSVSYDVENEDIKARHQFGINFMRSLKSKGDDEKANLDLSIFGPDDYSPGSFFDYESISHLESEEVDLPDPKPHPIKDFTNKYLKRYYYQGHLREFTRRLMQQIMASIEDSTRGALEIMASNARKKYNTAKKHISDRLRDIFTELQANDGGLPTIIDLFRKMQDDFSAKKRSVRGVIKNNFWNYVEQEQVPPRMRDAFIEYHDAYEEDIRLKNGGTQQAEHKKQAVTNLNDLLSGEATMLSRICRSVLLGIMLALALVPVLNLISPQLLDLGRVRRYAEWWSVGIFFLPILFQVLSWWRYERRKKNAINNLKALYLHDAYARVANRIESEVTGFYDKMIALAERYIKRTENIRDEVEKGFNDIGEYHPVIPETMFNQPLLGGRFGRYELLPVPAAIDTEIKINYLPYKISDIKKREYFLFLNQHHNMMMGLYQDVDVCENLVRRTNERGEEELVTKEQQEHEQQLLWLQHLANFQQQLSRVIKDSIVPRINNSVGEFLVANILGNVVPKNVLEPMVEYTANNGETTSSADLEMADLKVNDPRAVPYVFDYVSTPFKYDQVAKHNHLYQKYLFLTRWRSYEDFSLNRILPMEDFDDHIRMQRVYHEWKQAQDERSRNAILKIQGGAEVALQTPSSTGKYHPYPSTLLLWSLAPDDSSAEWFRLLDSEFFSEAYDDKEIYREVINPDD